MRLAVYHSLPSGGAKRALYESMRRLAQQHVLDVYTLSSAEHDYADLRPYAAAQHVAEFHPRRLFGSPLGRLNQWQRWRDLQSLRRLERRLAQTIDRGGYAAVLVHPNQWTQAPPVLRYLRTPSVYYVHEPLRSFHEAPIERPYAVRRARSGLDRWDPLIWLYRRTLAHWDWLATRQATVRLTNSKFTAEHIQRIYQCEVQVNALGVDAVAFRPPTESTPRRGVLSVGALRPNKGFDFIIEAIGRLAPGARPPLTIIANADDPAERAYLQQLAAERQVALEIEVMVSQARLTQAYGAAAVFVYAPVREPLGLAALEAMACGTPVLAVAEGGLVETVIDTHTGRLCRRDAAEFAAALGALLDDPAQRAAYGRQARRHVEEHWSWDQSVQQLNSHLEAVGRATHPALSTAGVTA